MKMYKNSLLSSIILVIAILIAWTFTPFENSSIAELEIGAKAPLADVEMKDVSGKMVSLADVKMENGLLVNFSCNTCPWVKRWEDRYNPVANLAKENGIGTIALNPNTAYRDKGDGFEDMEKRAKEMNYEFFYALDKDSKMAEAFGATRTPHIFLFNSDMELVYRGAIDDNARSADKVENQYLMDAIKSLGAGEEIATNTSKSLGCTIKWPE